MTSSVFLGGRCAVVVSKEKPSKDRPQHLNFEQTRVDVSLESESVLRASLTPSSPFSIDLTV